MFFNNLIFSKQFKPMVWCFDYNFKNCVVDNYVADITTVSDYYPFGSPMDGRTFSSEKYRFGFNEQEKDDEVAGAGNTNTALFWEFDTRLGRRWNLDPKPQVSISDYAVMGNSPIANIDLLGDYWGPAWDKGFTEEEAKIMLSVICELYTASGVFKKALERVSRSHHKYTVETETTLFPINSKSAATKNYQERKHKEYKDNTKAGGSYGGSMFTCNKFNNYGVYSSFFVTGFKSVVFEEIFHGAQDDYYIEKGIDQHPIYREIEAKIARTLEGFASEKWDSKFIMNFSRDYGELMTKYLSGKELSESENFILLQAVQVITNEILKVPSYGKFVEGDKGQFIENIKLDDVFIYLKDIISNEKEK